MGTDFKKRKCAHICKHCFETGHLYARANFWLKCHQKQFSKEFPFPAIQLCFGSCSVENKMQILLLLRENSQSPQLRGTTVNESVLILCVRSPFRVPKHQCSTCECSIISCIMEQATKQLLGPTLFESGRVGMECHCLPQRKLFLLPSPTCPLLHKTQSHVRN